MPASSPPPSPSLIVVLTCFPLHLPVHTLHPPPPPPPPAHASHAPPPSLHTQYFKSMKAAAVPLGSDGVHPGARLLVVREAPLDRMLALEARRGVALPLACPTLFDHRYCVTVTLGSPSTPSALSSPASSLSTLSPFAHLPSSTPSGTSVGPCFLLPPPKHNASALAFVAPQAASDPRAPQDRSASGRRAGDGVGLDVAGGGGVHVGDVGLRLLRFGEVEWAIVLERFPDVKYQLRGVPRKAWVGLPVVCQVRSAALCQALRCAVKLRRAPVPLTPLLYTPRPVARPAPSYATVVLRNNAA
jgi:hypothetical protein